MIEPFEDDESSPSPGAKTDPLVFLAEQIRREDPSLASFLAEGKEGGNLYSWWPILAALSFVFVAFYSLTYLTVSLVMGILCATVVGLIFTWDDEDLAAWERRVARWLFWRR